MANDYILLTTSDTLLSKKFAVLVEGYRPRLTKRSNVEETVNGSLDGQFGAIYSVHDYIVRVRYNEEEAGWGDLVDLRTFFELNNPNATPSNVITFQDHFGNEHNAWMIGDFQENILSAEVDTTEAWYNVRITLQIIPTPLS